MSTKPDGTLALRERQSLGSSIFRAAGGVFFLGVGTLTTYVFLFGDRPVPTGGVGQQILGWGVAALFLTWLGVVPIYFGFELCLIRRTYFIHLLKLELESRVTVAGLSLSRKRYPLSAFERVLVWHRPGKRSGVFIVSCAGPSQQVDLAAFHQRIAAEKLAADLGSQLGLRVELPRR